MKKGIVMKLEKKSAIVLTPDGEFCRIPRSGKELEVGKEVYFISEYEQSPDYTGRWRGLRSWKEWSASVAAFLIFMAIFIPVIQQWMTPQVSAYVAFDINPGVEMGINQHYIVMSAEALNSDGETILTRLDWKGKELSQVARELAVTAEQLGYLKDRHEILVTTTALDQAQETIMSGISQQVEKGLTGASATSVEIIAIQSTKELREDARKAGVSPGKYMVWKALENSGKHLSLEELGKTSIAEITRDVGDIATLLASFDGNTVSPGLKDAAQDQANENDNDGSITEQTDEETTDTDGEPSSSEQAGGEGTNGSGLPAKDSLAGYEANQADATVGKKTDVEDTIQSLIEGENWNKDDSMKEDKDQDGKDKDKNKNKGQKNAEKEKNKNRENQDDDGKEDDKEEDKEDDHEDDEQDDEENDDRDDDRDDDRREDD